MKKKPNCFWEFISLLNAILTAARDYKDQRDSNHLSCVGNDINLDAGGATSVPLRQELYRENRRKDKKKKANMWNCGRTRH